MKFWRTLFLTLLGVSIGIPLGGTLYTFHYANGTSYLSNDPRACINCHIMKDQFQSWQASVHHTVANCNDCHASGNQIQKYYAKAKNGLWHSWAFTTGRFAEPILIKAANAQAVVKSCRSCHANFIEHSQFHNQGFGEKNCLTCHLETGHRKW